VEEAEPCEGCGDVPDGWPAQRVLRPVGERLGRRQGKDRADAPVAVVTAKLRTAKKEEPRRVRQAAPDMFRHAPLAQPGAAKVDGGKFDEAIKALEAIK